MLALIIATAVGLGATWMTATHGTDVGTLTIGAWTARPKTGTADVDPYSRATIARSGELPVGTGDGVAFTATTDDRKRPLDGRCDVIVSGVTPAARFWTLTLYDEKGHLVAEFAAALRLHQPGNHPRRRRRVRDPGGIAVARRKLAAYRRHRALCADAPALRYAGRRRDADPARCADALDCDGGLPVIRLLFTIIAGVLLGGIVHLVSVLALPRIATQDAYSRLTPMTKLNAVTPLPLADPNNAPMPFMDPAFAIAICRYDLSGGSIKLSGPRQPGLHLGVVLHPQRRRLLRHQRPFRRTKVIELDLMTEAQHAELPEDEDVTAADRLIIDLPTATGLIVLKALAPEPGLMPQAQASLAARAARCRPSAAKQAEAPRTKR